MAERQHAELDKVERIATLKEELLPRIPQTNMHVLPGAGHLLLLEVPHALAQVIRKSLREVVAPKLLVGKQS